MAIAAIRGGKRMARRRREPEEALGPAIDGTQDVVTLAKMLLEPEEVEEEYEEIEEEVEEEGQQIVLICGGGATALEVGRVASSCGFAIELVSDSVHPLGEELVDLAEDVYVLENYEDFVRICQVDRNYYICIFVDDPQECENILMQCLASDASYVGACTNGEQAALVRMELRNQGVPDAELAALCCPMGLAIGARTACQEAVAIVAEIMAARSGVLKRLRCIE